MPKAASNSWRQLLVWETIAHQLNSTEQDSTQAEDLTLAELETLSRNYPLVVPLTKEELMSKTGGFYSFLTVRHPFERVLSAYKDRFFVLDGYTRQKEKSDW